MIYNMNPGIMETEINRFANPPGKSKLTPELENTRVPENMTVPDALIREGKIQDQRRAQEAQEVDGYSGSTRNIGFNPWQMESAPAPEPEPEIPAMEVPDAMQDPGGHISAMTRNRSMGAGNAVGMPRMPEMPTPQQAEAKMMDEKAKQVMFDQNKIPKWQDSRAFSGGLLSMGLNLLSGNDLATSFAAAGKYFDDGYAREKRELWANDLAEQGFDAQDIHRWIETGDNKDLPDPMEKKRAMQQYNMGQQQLENLQYESTPRMREYRRQMEQMPLLMQQAQMQQSAMNAARSNDLAERRFAYTQNQDRIKAAAGDGTGGKPDSKMFMSGTLMGSVNENAFLYAPTAGDYAKLAVIEKLPERAQEAAMQQMAPEFHAWTQARNQMSEMLGRALSGAALSETKERPTWTNALVPTQSEIKSNDTAAIQRKANVRNALAAYSNSVASGSEGRMNLNDVNMLAKGSANMMVDEHGIPRAIKYSDGSLKQL